MIMMIDSLGAVISTESTPIWLRPRFAIGRYLHHMIGFDILFRLQLLKFGRQVSEHVLQSALDSPKENL